MTRRMFNASHLEVKKYFTENFQTQPYEAGWASEVIFFIMVEEMSGIDPCITAKVQISHDGINWCDEGSVSEQINAEGLHFIKVKHFGNYLRLDCRISGSESSFKLNIQIACKE